MSNSIYVPDASSIESGLVATLIEEGAIDGKIVIHDALVAKFEERALRGDILPLEKIREIKARAAERGISVELEGGGPTTDERAAVRLLAMRLGATIITSDSLMKKVAEVVGVNVIYRKPAKRLTIEQFFAEGVMSVHLKEGVPPRIKKGVPGSWTFETVGDKPLTREEIESAITDVYERVRSSEGAGFIEIDKSGSTIIQLGDYRIVITRPPFSDGLEVTAVRPIVKLSLEDYSLPPRLVERLRKQAEGILIAGSPGMGKSTFAQALAEFYMRNGKVVKTIESPRDLQLPPEITQYSKDFSAEEIHDVLLLSRPDYTIFDELRTEDDFDLYADLRFAGVGMVGVIHATSPIDAIQRFVKRIDLGVVPSVIDTVIFMDRGRVAKVYTLETTVKIPVGLAKPDLARPVVLVKDFNTGKPEYELYVFGDRTFVVPIREERPVPASREVLLARRILKRYVPDFTVTKDEGVIKVKVPAEYYSIVLKKCYRRLRRLGQKLGVPIDVEPMAPED